MAAIITKRHILAYINANRKSGEEISLENPKENPITAEERLDVEKRWGAEMINKLFGEPSHLQKAEMMILAIEKDELDEQTKYEYIISIAHAISNACGMELDSGNEVWEKYATVYCRIPITVFTYDKKPLDYVYLKRKEVYVSADELRTAQIWSNTEEAKTDLEKKEYLKYISEATYISLKKIFAEVKKEIMGE